MDMRGLRVGWFERSEPHQNWLFCSCRQHPGRLGAEPLGLGFTLRFGNRTDNRLRVARADQEPTVGPIKPQAVKAVGGGVGK